MRETTLTIAARRLSAPIIAELARLLGHSAWPLDDGEPHEDAEPLDDDEFLREVWQEVGDDLRHAMRRYTLAHAQADVDATPLGTAAGWSAGRSG